MKYSAAFKAKMVQKMLGGAQRKLSGAGNRGESADSLEVAA